MGDTDPDELAELGYEQDGIMWLAVTPATATREQALTEFARGNARRRAWRVTGRRELVVDERASRWHGELHMVPTTAEGADLPHWVFG